VADLFDLGDLPSWLQIPEVDAETATRVRRMASGWLQDATGLTDWPDPVPDRLWGWALELAGLALNNPAAVWSETVGSVSTVYERGAQGRRREILNAARAAYNVAGGPMHSFPAADWRWPSTNPC
jgi:hypothetical protein